MMLKGINLKSALFAGFVAAWVMYFVDNWLGGLFGLFGMFPGMKSPAWMIEHHVDGMIIALLFAWRPVYMKMPGAPLAKGLVFGLLWTIGLVILIFVGGALGAKALQAMQGGGATGMISVLLLHLLYGGVLGALYRPKDETIASHKGA